MVNSTGNQTPGDQKRQKVGLRRKAVNDNVKDLRITNDDFPETMQPLPGPMNSQVHSICSVFFQSGDLSPSPQMRKHLRSSPASWHSWDLNSVQTHSRTLCKGLERTEEGQDVPRGFSALHFACSKGCVAYQVLVTG